MAPLFDRHDDASLEPTAARGILGSGPDDAVMEDAAEALRQVEVEAVQPDVPNVSSLTPSQLDQMNIDELRVVAKELDVPDRSKITERDELIAAIWQRL